MKVPIEKVRPEKVAIIGSGPAGMSCAYNLARKGYRPTIFEALPVTGGMFRVGIPGLSTAQGCFGPGDRQHPEPGGGI